MEFPNLGKHCAEKTCKQLDFLPFTCDSCKQIFCLEHRTYADHNCVEPKKDAHVPACPLCDQPVSVNIGEQVDVAMDKHISGGCKSEQAQRLRKNRCSMKRCKTSELIPFHCKGCNQQFCVKHRTVFDHKCPSTNRNKPEVVRTIGPFRIPVRVSH